MLVSRLNRIHRGASFHGIRLALFVVLSNALASANGSAAERPKRPNIILILADDLGYGDIGCYGQTRVQTPHLDRLAAGGIRFTSAYAGSTVCAPSRCALMTGYHCGHARVRGNSLIPLADEDLTIAELLKSQGYATAAIGKWGLGEPETTGLPNRQGFDQWFGYLNQVHAHNYYPDFLWRNETRFPLPGNIVRDGVASVKSVYTPDLLTQVALDFIEVEREGPFFLYFPIIIPHANNEAGNDGMEVPSDAPYSREDWPTPEKNHAAMVTRLDDYVGRIMAKLAELGLEEQTLVLFSSDNGPHREGGFDPDFFSSAGPFRGIKRDLYEGGIRVPLIANWPGRIRPNRESDLPVALWDLLPTIAEFVGQSAPADSDGMSLAPDLTGTDATTRTKRPAGHEYLYWEFHERGFQQAARRENWKAVRPQLGAGLEIFDLASDPGETRDLSAKREDLVKEFEKYFAGARSESADFVPKAKASK